MVEFNNNPDRASATKWLNRYLISPNDGLLDTAAINKKLSQRLWAVRVSFVFNVDPTEVSPILRVLESDLKKFESTGNRRVEIHRWATGLRDRIARQPLEQLLWRRSLL